jgi:hypothetical protein
MLAQATKNKKLNKKKVTYIDGNNTWRILNINGSIWEELDFTIFAWFKLEEYLFLPNFSEVEFVPIKGLEDLINTELSWPLLKMAALIQLGNETIRTRDHLHQEHNQKLE